MPTKERLPLRAGLDPLLIALAAVLMTAAQYAIFYHAPVEETMGMVQKIFYLHLPMAWWAMISFLVVFLCSVLYLLKRDIRFDHVAGAAAEIGVLLSALALITGSLWGRAAWNTWWTWDPRLTTTLVMWFIYCGYLLQRSGMAGRERQPLISAVIGIVAFLDVPLVFLSARLWRSIHPAVFASRSGGLEPEMWTTVVIALVAWGAVWLVLLRMRLNQFRAESRVDSLVTRSPFSGESK
jgi:heme exporter protein C